MKSKLIAAAIGIALLIPAAAFAQGIRNSRHDLSFSSTTGGPKATSNVELCIFCHTPHKANATRVVWNHSPTTVTAWTWGGETVTAEGTTLATTLTAVSKRCLGCHDGSVALGDVSNAGGGTAGTIATSAGMGAGYTVGAGGVMAGNHPVSIPYAGSTYNAIVSSATDDDAIGNYYADTSTGCTSPSGVCTAATGDSRDGPAINLIGAVGTSGVECTSCHEPHNKLGGSYFLRVTTTASGLCRSCHNK